MLEKWGWSIQCHFDRDPNFKIATFWNMNEDNLIFSWKTKTYRKEKFAGSQTKDWQTTTLRKATHSEKVLLRNSREPSNVIYNSNYGELLVDLNEHKKGLKYIQKGFGFISFSANGFKVV